MHRHGRSRSPGRTQWISRAIVSFGRYPDRRPQGLQVDEKGFITMASLMESWGRSHGISEEDILASVHAHMFDEKRGPGSLRFQISTDSCGGYIIGVTPKRGVATPMRSEGRYHHRHERQDWRGGPQDWRSGSADRGWWSGGRREQNWQEPRWGEGQQRSWGSNWQERGERNHHHERGGPEVVQRWLAWALVTGYQELGIKLQGQGRARLEDLANALREKRPDFGIGDEKQLLNFLQSTDHAGRFAVDGLGCVYKVHRDQRCPRMPACGQSMAREESPMGPTSLGQSLARGQSLSRGFQSPASAAMAPSFQGGAPSMGQGAVGQGFQAAATVNQGFQGAAAPVGAVVQAQQAAAAAPPATAAPAAAASADPSKPTPPAPPPGPHWTKYTDEGHLWWHYEGPLGQWWCADQDKEVLPLGE